MSDEIVVRQPPAGELALAHDRTDARIVQLWLAGRSRNTIEAYAADADRLFAFMKKPLAAVVLEDLQEFAESLVGLAPNTRKRILAAMKSLFSFAASDGIGHLRYNVAAAIRLPKSKNTRNERKLSEEQVRKLIAEAMPGRNRQIVELLYLVGIRAEELTALCWRDVVADGESGILTVFGKGEKTRHLRLSPETWMLLVARRRKADADVPIFPSRSGRALSTVQVWRIVSQAARRAGLEASPHWLRHSHATHAMDHGCDIRVLQQSLGHSSIETTQQYIHSRPKESSGAFVKRTEEK